MIRSDDRPLAGQPWLRDPRSQVVLKALTSTGRPARFVGGCVRDGLLGRAVAAQDLDLATPLRPEEVLRVLEAAEIKAIPTGIEHGTVTAVVDGWRFEITTLRRDVACDGRHAVVEFTDDFRADAARRDFTINAMSCDGEGRLYDYFGGRADLEAGRIRFVGEAARRIAEDHLRILRFFRFFAHYGREPADPEALEACGAAATEIRRLSGERVQMEMLKLLAADDPLPALRLMVETGVLAQVIPGRVALDRLARLLDVAPDADPLLRLAALLRPPPASDDAAQRVAERWRLARRDAQRLEALVTSPLPRLDVNEAERGRDLHRFGPELYADLARLAAAETADRAGLRKALEAARRWQPKTLPLSGDDILALGVPPGPRVGEILKAVEAWWICNDFRPDHAQCLAKARSLLTAEPGKP